MPAPGDQHKANGATTVNPFEDSKTPPGTVTTEYTAEEATSLQANLRKRLGPEYISTRSGPGGGRVAYLSAEKAIALANEVFGFNGWSSSIQNIQIDFVDENPQKGTISIGLSVIVRVTLKDGTYHEDVGYGGIENSKSKIAAFEKAKKEGTTDGLKRALRNFGNVLGNCIYDKEYITRVSKIAKGQGKWDVEDLHRHEDFVPKKQPIPQVKPTPQPSDSRPTSLMLQPEDSFDAGEFEEADFDDIGNPDEVLLPREPAHPAAQPSRNAHPSLARNITPSKLPQVRPQQPQQINNPARPTPQPQNISINAPTTNSNHQLDNKAPSRSSSPGLPSQHFAPPASKPGVQTAGFYSARVADNLDGNNNPTSAVPVPMFNPHAESPSIRKTQGVDHSKSLALNRHTLKPEPLPSPGAEKQAPPTPMGRPGMAPSAGGSFAGAGASPLSRAPSTSGFRPPTRHGPPPNVNGPASVISSAKRAPLSDLSNVQQNQQGMNGASEGENKRPKIGVPGPIDAASFARENVK